MPILIDYSQIAISCAFAFPEDMKKGNDTGKMQDIIRHVTLKSIVTYKREYGPRFGDVILCADTSPLWRKAFFPYYKQHRKKNREESPTDWEAILKFKSELQHDLEDVFPYPVVKAVGAEGDDCVAVLTKMFAANPMDMESENPLDALSGEPLKTLIVSSDHDFKQLHKYKNVKQWSPMQKKWVEKPESDFLYKKIIAGDQGDGVPSVLMPDDWYVNGEGRAKPVTKSVYQHYLEGNLTEEEKQRFHRNKTLIDFDYIPEHIEKSILDSYVSWKKKGKKQDIMNYLVKHRLSQLMERLTDF